MLDTDWQKKKVTKMDMWDKIRYYRIENKVSQQEVANALGWKQPNYAKAEKVKLDITKEDIKKIALAIHVDASVLLGVDDILLSTYPSEIKKWLCEAKTQKLIMDLFKEQA